MSSTSIVITLLSSSVLSATIGAIASILITRSGKKEREEIRKEEREDKAEERAEEEKRERYNFEKKIIEYEEHMRNTDEKLECLMTSVEDYMSSTKSLAEAIIYSNKLLMQDRIRQEAEHYIKKGEISFERRKLLHDMWDTYHEDWKGNGDLNLVMELVDSLPMEVK